MGSDREAVRGILQSGYGDATQTVLDDRVASDILNGLRERGWASPAEVAAIIHAAGGDVQRPHARNNPPTRRESGGCCIAVARRAPS